VTYLELILVHQELSGLQPNLVAVIKGVVEDWWANWYFGCLVAELVVVENLIAELVAEPVAEEMQGYSEYDPE